MVETTTTGAEIDYTSYCQVVPMTFEEKVAMYMRCTKLELARMLAERDRLGLDTPPQIVPAPYPVYPSYPNVPWGPAPVWYGPGPVTCQDPNTGYGYSTSATTEEPEYPDEGYQEPPKFDAYDASIAGDIYETFPEFNYLDDSDKNWGYSSLF